jgi:hypothetical protein
MTGSGVLLDAKEWHQMSKGKPILLSLITILSTLAVLAPSAGALIKFQWKVGGKILEEAAETREFTVTSDGRTFDFIWSLAGAGVLLLSSEIEVEKGAKIIGGKPGTNEETVIFKGVTVVKPAGCAVESEGSPTGTVKTNLLKTEIVESQESHQPLILFKPKTGTVFVSLLLLNKGTETCIANNALGNVTGNILAEPLPQLTEVLTQHLIFEAKTKEFLLNPGGGTIEKAGLSFAGAAATLTGLALVLLVKHELFGAF